MELEGFRTVRVWFQRLETARGTLYPNTKKNYLAGLRRFCDYAGKTPDQLIEERKRRLSSSKHRFDEDDDDLLAGFHNEMRKKYKAGTIHSWAMGVKSFYRENRVPLTLKVGRGFEEDIPYLRASKDDIHRILSFADSLRDKLLITIAAESGLRLRALSELTYGAVKKDFEKGIIPNQIELPRKFYSGRKGEGITFFCEDGVNLLKQYLESRKKRGEPITDETPLFASYWKNNGPLKYYVEGCQVKPLGYRGIHANLTRLLKKADLYKRGERRISVHSFRKYLSNQIKIGGMQEVFAKVIIGHSNAIEDHYTGRRFLNIEEIREAYGKAMPYVSLSDTTQLQEMADDLKRLREENERLKVELAKSATFTTEALEEVTQQINEAIAEGFRTGQIPKIKIEVKRRHQQT